MFQLYLCKFLYSCPMQFSRQKWLVALSILMEFVIAILKFYHSSTVLNLINIFFSVNQRLEWKSPVSVRWAFQWANKKWLEKRGLPSFINQSSVFAKPLPVLVIMMVKLFGLQVEVNISVNNFFLHIMSFSILLINKQRSCLGQF